MDTPTKSDEVEHPHLPTKLGQPSTSSPRTAESNRLRLTNLFSSLSFIPASQGGSSSSHTTPQSPSRPSTGLRRKTEQMSARSPLWNWLSPKRDGIGDAVNEGEEWEEGCFVNVEDEVRSDETVEESTTIELGMGGRGGKNATGLMRLPDEILLQILLHSSESAEQLLALSRVSRHFFSLSQSPLLWSTLFGSTPGFQILPSHRSKLVAAPHPPGRWEGHSFFPHQLPPFPSSLTNRSFASPRRPRKDDIPVHYPTLYRSRLALSRIIHAPNPAPPHRMMLNKHTDSVYCLHLSLPWLITGSRDRSVRIWYIPPLAKSPLAPDRQYDSSEQVERAACVKAIEKAHGGSVLSVGFELVDDDAKGMMVTGSSDMTAGVWEMTFKCERRKSVQIEKKGILRGHTGGVLDVALGKTRIVTCSKDTDLRIYDRSTLGFLYSIQAHAGPVNCLSLNPDKTVEQVVSASGDGIWIVWDTLTGQEVRRGGGEGRGLACITWEGSYILTGDNDRLLKLFDAEATTLIRTYEGHHDLVRTVAIDLSTRTIVSGSYDKTIRMWNLDKTEVIRRVQGGHTSLVFGVGMQQGRTVSVSHDHSVQILTFGPTLPYRGLFA